MNSYTRYAAMAAIGAFLIGFYLFVIPSLIGLLISVLIVISINDFFARRYQNAARTFNMAAQTVCHQDGAMTKVATAFARTGPLRGPCYEYARRLLVGEDPIAAAARSRVPLQLTTAVAMLNTDKDMVSQRKALRERLDRQAIPVQDTILMPAYAHVMYLVITALATCVLLTFMSIFIVPTMEKMMEEFGLAMPHLWLVAGDAPVQAILAFVILFMLVLIPILSTGTFFGIPVPRWMPRSPRVVEAKADMLRGIADALEGGMTVDQALDLAVQISVKRSDAASLTYANALIRQGTLPADALYKAGWLTAVERAWIGGTTMTRGAELLRSVADQRVRDAHARVRWLIEVVFPILVILLGIAVLFFAVGFFGSLVSLIGGLA